MKNNHRGRLAAMVLTVVLAVSTGGHAQALGYRIERMLIPFGVVELRLAEVDGERRVFLFDMEGNAFRVGMDAGGLSVRDAAPPPAFPRPTPSSLPDGVVATGGRGIEAAWLTDPTTRYAHGALGDAVEAGGLAAWLADGRVLQLTLGHDAVFEDRTPRLADMNGDGDDEVLVVKSYLDRGAALAVADADGSGLRIAAESTPLGQPNRWLNPVGTGDFDGDGRIEAAAVTTPHIGGTLRVYEMHAGRLVEEFALPGFSNHALGSRQLGLAGVVDVTADGVPDLAVPGDGRRLLKVVTLVGGRFQTVAAIAHAAAIATDIVVHDLDGNGRKDLIYGLENRFLVAVLWDE